MSGTDYSPIVLGTLRIPEGQNTSSATVNILDDLLPERDEVFMVRLYMRAEFERDGVFMV